ncbi:MAG: redoxin domain-containing protein [Deltaproteobacteria bacterium]
MTQVEIYGKSDCSLCDDAKAILERVRAQLPFELVEVDIELDPKLFEQFKNDIPVVYVDGRKAFKHRIDEAALVRRLERARAFTMGTLDPRATLTRGRPVGRGTKLVFFIAVVVAIALVFANKIYQRTVVERQAELQSLDLEAESFPAPEFSLSDQRGEKHRLEDYRGKVVLLNFWATWCPPCRQEIPSMRQLAARMDARKDFALVALSVDDGWAPIRELFRGEAPGFQVLWDDGGRVSRAFGTTKYPESYVIDRNGNVIAKFVGPRDWSTPASIHYFERLLGDGRG